MTSRSDCGHQETRVLRTRAGAGGAVIRRRECAVCGFRFNTVEVPAGGDAAEAKLDRIERKLDRVLESGR